MLPAGPSTGIGRGPGTVREGFRMLAPLSRPSLSGLSSVTDPQKASSGVSTKALSEDKRSGVGLDQVGRLLSNHDRGGVRVATHDRGHDRGIYDPEPLDTVYAQSSIDD